MEIDEREGPRRQSLGDLTIREKIGEGSSAEVFVVDHAILGGSAALKWWRNPLSAGDEQRFISECRLQRRISEHPNIVTIQWAEAPPGQRPWLVMDLYEESLLERLTRGPRFTPDEAFSIADGTLAGLSEIHRLEHVHRDVKPANVLLRDGVPALGDLGISMLVGATTVASAAGTVGYRAPELGLGSPPTYRSDVYSAGMTLRALFAPDCPEDVDDLLTRATSHRPEDRPADAAAFRAALAELRPEPVGLPPVPGDPASDRVRAGSVGRRPRRVAAVLVAAATVLGLTATGVYAAQGSAHVSAWLSAAAGGEAQVAGPSADGSVTSNAAVDSHAASPSPSPFEASTPTGSPSPSPTSPSSALPSPTSTPSSPTPLPTPKQTPDAAAVSPPATADGPSASPTHAQTKAPVKATTTTPKRCNSSPKLSGVPRSSGDPRYVVRGAFPCKPSGDSSRVVVIELSGIDPSNPHREYYLRWFVSATDRSWAADYDASRSADPGLERSFYVVDLTPDQLADIRSSDRRVQSSTEGYYGGDGDDPVGEILRDARTSPTYPNVWTG